ncbi:hypothetical protein DFH27DRAFT_649271 [Peziza echinospora]|nr:hypothetical protein DFH27DRAFT_649271 [Peziza echinospora]
MPRLRRRFLPPSSDSDSDSDTSSSSLPTHMDEQEQSELLTLLRTHDTSQTDLYTTLFTLLFLLPTLHSFVHLCAHMHPLGLRVMALSSLVGTVWGVRFMRLPAAERIGGGGGGGEASGADARGPVERYLEGLNGVLAGVVGVLWWLWVRRNSALGGAGAGGGEEPTKKLLLMMIGEMWVGYVPAVVWGMGFVVRRLLRPVDVDSLQGLRYKYKGA